MARPPLSIEQRRQNGDTRKLGPRAFAASLEGSPDLPKGLPDQPDFGDDALAAGHWSTITEAAGAKRILREVDQGTLAGVCLMFSGMMQAAAAKQYKLAAELYQRYNQGGDRLGLSGSARARLTIPAGEGIDPIERALAG